MTKRMILLAMAVGALVAFSVPTVASAQLLKQGTKPLPVGAEFTATSTNLVTTTELGHLTCSKVTLHLKVTKNEGATSSAATTGVTTEGCHLVTTPNEETFPATITNASASFHIQQKGVGTATATFLADIGEPVFAECHEEGTPGITYVAGTDAVHVQGALGGPCGAAEIHGDFTLETANGETVTVN